MLKTAEAMYAAYKAAGFEKEALSPELIARAHKKAYDDVAKLDNAAFLGGASTVHPTAGRRRLRQAELFAPPSPYGPVIRHRKHDVVATAREERDAVQKARASIAEHRRALPGGAQAHAHLPDFALPSLPEAAAGTARGPQQPGPGGSKILGAFRRNKGLTAAGVLGAGLLLGGSAYALHRHRNQSDEE